MTGAGFTAITCGGRAPACSVPGCGRESTAACDYPVVRRGRKGTCDKKLCDRCRVRQGDDIDFCPPHSKLPPAPG